MQKINEIETNPTIFDQFVSFIAIRRSATSVLAIGRPTCIDRDFLVRYFQIQSQKFNETIIFLQHLQKFTHSSVQPIRFILTEMKTSEICVLYDAECTLLERIETKNFLSETELISFVKKIRVGLAAQRDHMSSSNNFLDEWNIFQNSKNCYNFTYGIAFPAPNQKLLVPLNDKIARLNCEAYNNAFDIQKFAVDDIDEIKDYDTFCLGLLALKAIGMHDYLNKALQKCELARISDFKQVLREILEDKFQAVHGNKESFQIINHLLFESSESIDSYLSTLSSPDQMKAPLILSPIHSLTNGEGLIREPNGHHGTKFKKTIGHYD